MITTNAPRFFMRADHDGLSVALMRSLFQNSEFGIILTGMKREILAANEIFGEIFDVDPNVIVEAEDPGILERHVSLRFPDPEAYLRWTDEVFADPRVVVHDEIELLGPERFYRRYSGPIFDEQGECIARMWTFRDITDERRMQTMRDALYQVSVFNDPDPWRVCTFVAETIGTFYGGNGVVSIIRNDFLEFRDVGGPPGPVTGLVGTPLDQSICQVPIELLSATIIPDPVADERTAQTLPVRMGVETYMGVPLLSAQGTVRGTLALMGRRREVPLGEEDLRFLSMLGMRVSNELERARIVEVELAARQAIVEEQAGDLTATREVLDAMVHAFDLVSFDEPIETVLVAQAALLENLLGFGTVAILTLEGSEGRPVVATPYEFRNVATTEAIEEVRRPLWLRRDALRQIGLDGFTEGLAVPLGSERRSFGFLVYEAERRIELDDHRRIHLEAIAEQVALTLEAYTLRSELIESGRQAAAREDQAVLAARLATSGLLAATVAHDVKNIVAAISLELSSTAEPVRALAAVRTHLDRFAILSHRLLSYSKPRMVAKRPVDLDELIKRVTGLFADHLRISDIQLVFSPAKIPTIILGDPHQIEHLFANIILNSIQAMSAKNGGLIEIKAKRTAKKAIIEVRDTGPGVKEDNLDKMFEPFVGFRHEGFGLGLFSARRIANEHGGDMKVTSTLGVGTTILVTLQAAPSDQ